MPPPSAPPHPPHTHTHILVSIPQKGPSWIELICLCLCVAFFAGFGSLFLKYKKFFKLRARKLHFPKYKKPFLRVGFFHFLGSESYFLKCKTKYKARKLPISRKMKKFRYARVLNIPFLRYKKKFRFLKIRKAYFEKV